MPLIHKQSLTTGDIFAYPTDTVWGIGCSANDTVAINKIKRLKQRSKNKGFVLLVDHWWRLGPVFDQLSDELKQRLQQPRTEATTWLINHQQLIAADIVGPFATVAVRQCSTPLVKRLCTAFSAPIISSSANFRQQTPARHFWQVKKQFKHHIDITFYSAQHSAATPSQLIDLTTLQRLR